MAVSISNDPFRHQVKLVNHRLRRFKRSKVLAEAWARAAARENAAAAATTGALVSPNAEPLGAPAQLAPTLPVESGREPWRRGTRARRASARKARARS